MTGAVNFFKPARCLLDSIWFTLVPLVDAAPVPADTVISIFTQNDGAPPAIDTITANAWVLSDTKLIMPLYDAHFYHTGISYGQVQPAVADSGVVVLGSPVAVKT